MTRSKRALGATALVAAALAACGERSTPPLAVTTESSAAPRAVAFDPPLGATGVDPARATLAVTFDRAMDPEGWAWVIESPETAPEIGESSWDTSTRTNTVAVNLEPGRSYVVWVNSTQHPYFRDSAGRSVAPVRWAFATAGAPRPSAAARPSAPIAPVPAHSAAPRVAVDPPRVVALDPPNGATDVDPARTLLRATFDRPMEASWAWVTEGGDSFPEMAGQGYFESDGRTAALPVRLAPGRTYVVWLNSEQHPLFRDLAGTPAAPLRWSFTTRGR